MPKFVLIFGLFGALFAAQASPARQAAHVVFFRGGMSAALSEIGPDIPRGLGELPLGARVNITHRDYEWFEAGHACRDLGTTRPNSHLILVGHSYGGHAAMVAADCLSRLGVRVDLLITLDSIRNPTLDGAALRTTPCSVTRHYNFFQRADLVLRGVMGKTRRPGCGNAEPTRNLNLDLGGLSPHSSFDNRALDLVIWLAELTINQRATCERLPGWQNTNNEHPTVPERQVISRTAVRSHFELRPCP